MAASDKVPKIIPSVSFIQENCSLDLEQSRRVVEWLMRDDPYRCGKQQGWLACDAHWRERVRLLADKEEAKTGNLLLPTRYLIANAIRTLLHEVYDD